MRKKHDSKSNQRINQHVKNQKESISPKNDMIEFRNGRLNYSQIENTP